MSMSIEQTIAETLLDIDPDIATKFKGYFYRNPICEGWSLFRKLFPLGLATTDPILDVGCGNGGLLFYLWHEGYRNLHGSDITEQKLAWTRELHARHGVQSTLTLSDLMDRISGQYACIFAMGFLYEDPARLQIFLEQSRNRLIRGGRVIFNWPTWEKNAKPLRPYYSESQVIAMAKDCGLSAAVKIWSKTERHVTGIFECQRR